MQAMPELAVDDRPSSATEATEAGSASRADGAGAGHGDEATFLVGWGALWAAIALNVSQVFLLDSSEGLRQPALLPLAAGGFLVELWLFGRAVRCLSPVVAFAAYGATPAVVTLLSVTAFGEALTLPKIAGVGLVTIGIILLAGAGTTMPKTTCAEMAPDQPGSSRVPG
jgi:multidrug transporter EmrE-like cation transporter